MRPATAALFDWLSEWAVPESLRTDSDVFRQAKRVAVFDFTFLFWVVAFAGIALAMGSPRSALVTLCCVPIILMSLAMLERGRSPIVCGNVLCLAGSATLIALACMNGGASAPQLLWLVCPPVVAVLTAGILSGLVWMLIEILAIAAFVAAEALGVSFPQELSDRSILIYYYLALAGLIVCHFLLAWVRVGVEQRALVALHETNQRLADAQSKLDLMQTHFGFSMDEWGRLKREKAALEFVLRRRVAGFGVSGGDDSDPEDDRDLDSDSELVAVVLGEIEVAKGAPKPKRRPDSNL